MARYSGSLPLFYRGKNWLKLIQTGLFSTSEWLRTGNWSAENQVGLATAVWSFVVFCGPVCGLFGVLNWTLKLYLHLGQNYTPGVMIASFTSSYLSSSYLISASILSNHSTHFISLLVHGCGLVSSYNLLVNFCSTVTSSMTSLDLP